jgi:hypothetical protein
MGYRSDVVLVAEFDTEAIRNAAWVGAKLKYENTWTWSHTEKFDHDAIVFEAESVKWYGSYPEVSQTSEMFKEFFLQNFDANVKEVIVGEELDDMVDELYEAESHRAAPDWFYDIGISRSIDAPWKWTA